MVLEKMTRQLSKLHDRRIDRHRGARIDTEPSAPAGEDLGDEPSYEDIVNREIKGE
jgi:hypothetical protein